MALLLAVVVGLLAGLLTGGSLAGLSLVRFRSLPLVFIALLAQVVIFTGIAGRRAIIHDIGPYIYIATLGLLLFFMWQNRQIAGMKLILLGTALNALVIVANGGFMPAPEDKLRAAGRLNRVEGSGVLSNSKVADDGTNLLFLGDNFAIPERYPLNNAVSIGDLVIAAGALYASFHVTRRRPNLARAEADVTPAELKGDPSAP
jgi:hypothetical protein